MTTPNADGLYQLESSKPAGSVLHRDVADVKEGLQELSKQLENFKIPTTVGMTVEVEIDNNKKIAATTTRMLGPNETVEEGHEKLYKQCLESLAKLIT